MTSNSMMNTGQETLLLVLDINGLLLHREPGTRGARGITLNPEAIPTLQRLDREGIEFAFWTAKPTTEAIFEGKMLAPPDFPQPLFVWGQEKCLQPPGELSDETPGKPLYLKLLGKVWSAHPRFAERTVIIDHSPEKLTWNPPGYAIVLPKWEPGSAINALAEGGPLESLSEKLKKSVKLDDAVNEANAVIAWKPSLTAPRRGSHIPRRNSANSTAPPVSPRSSVNSTGPNSVAPPVSRRSPVNSTAPTMNSKDDSGEKARSLAQMYEERWRAFNEWEPPKNSPRHRVNQNSQDSISGSLGATRTSMGSLSPRSLVSPKSPTSPKSTGSGKPKPAKRTKPVFAASMLSSNAWSSGMSGWSGFTATLKRSPAEVNPVSTARFLSPLSPVPLS